ncbi:hypothetical protein JX266_006833 [Neoarthrinium moseri]|nr:hypothetical protein JX266_006833 [Neoarthrinium moseri]
MTEITNNHADTRIRKLGCHEGYQLAMHTLDQYRGTVVACSYCPPSSLPQPESFQTLKTIFLDAIARVVLAQPHLQVGITGENSKNPAFVRLNHLHLHNHIKWRLLSDPSDRKAVYLESMQDQLDSRFDHLSTQPGWRLTILHEAKGGSIEVLYAWNHPHHDGMSGKIFHQQLMRSLNDPLVQNKAPMLDNPEGSDGWILNLPDPSDRLPPNPELLSRWPMTPTFLLRTLWNELKPPSIFPPGKMHATWAPIKASPFTTRFHTFTVNNDIVTRVVTACRQHHTTLTGLMQALILVSLSSALKDTKGFASRTPYDLRQILPSGTAQYSWLKPKESMCNYVSVVDHEFDANLVTMIRSKMSSQDVTAGLEDDVMDIIWPVAARVRQEIQARLNWGVWNDMIGIMKFVSDWRTQQQREAQKIRYFSWLVTNLGVLDGEVGNSSVQEDGWSLRRAELVLSSEVPSAAISVSIMTVKDEQMCVTCSWQDCVVDLDLGKRLAGDLERWLHEIGSSL